MTLRPAIADFESYAINGRPDYPPKPVGVSIKLWGKAARYYAFGHPTGNNCTEGQAKAALAEVWGGPDGVVFHNAKFDVDVAETHWGLKRLAWDKIHDTLFLLFLDDPNQSQLGLKPAAERLLGMKPEERDAVEEWLMKKQPVPGVKISRSKQSEFYWARYIAYAPGDLVGKYANGDTARTEALFKLLHKKTLERGMGAAYDRERKLMPILLDVERQGVRVDLKRLQADVSSYQAKLALVEAWICKAIKAPEGINLSSGDQLVKAMIKVGKVDLDRLGVTPKSSKPRTDKESLANAVTDKVLLAMLRYRTQLNTCLNTFMKPWLVTALKSKGLIYTYWNQVRGVDEGGTRTGRLSSSPNFQNIPKTFKPIFKHETRKEKLPKCPVPGLPALPLVRSYITPFKPGHVLLDRDYSQQEPRILAHFEGGLLMQQYQANPWIDFHDNAKETLEKVMGKPYDRKVVKTINLGLIYGMGVGKLALKNESTVEETKAIKDAILAMYPGLKAMFYDMRVRAVSNKPIRTWGGRESYCEPAKIIDGKMRTYDYKMVNTLIQGSAGDCTKEAIIRWWESRKPDEVFLLNVHDELLISAPRAKTKRSMEGLRVAMESVEFDVKILSEGKISDTNWAELKEYDKKGKLVLPLPGAPNGGR